MYSNNISDDVCDWFIIAEHNIWWSGGLSWEGIQAVWAKKPFSCTCFKKGEWC